MKLMNKLRLYPSIEMHIYNLVYLSLTVFFWFSVNSFLTPEKQ